MVSSSYAVFSVNSFNFLVFSVNYYLFYRQMVKKVQQIRF